MFDIVMSVATSIEKLLQYVESVVVKNGCKRKIGVVKNMMKEILEILSEKSETEFKSIKEYLEMLKNNDWLSDEPYDYAVIDILEICKFLDGKSIDYKIHESLKLIFEKDQYEDIHFKEIEIEDELFIISCYQNGSYPILCGWLVKDCY